MLAELPPTLVIMFRLLCALFWMAQAILPVRIVNHADLTLQFQQSASLRLLQARNAPLTLSVLFSAFKREHVPSINESRLRAILEAELGEQR